MRISTNCFLIATTIALAACSSGTAPVTEMDRPDPELQETQGDGGIINYEATYTYSEKCKDLASVQCTLNISSQAGDSASESLMCATEFAACTATIVGGITGACDAGDVTPKVDENFVVVVTYTSQLQFPPTVECFSGT